MENMNKLLADIAVLNQKAYNLHWNVRGANFLESHKMTEALYIELTELFDEVAEKISMSGGTPISTLAGYIKAANIKEIEPKAFTPNEVVKTVVTDLEVLKASVLAVKQTPENQTVLDLVLQSVEKQKWFFASSVK